MSRLARTSSRRWAGPFSILATLALITGTVWVAPVAATPAAPTNRPDAPAPASHGPGGHSASGFETIKGFVPDPARPNSCAYNGGFFSDHFSRGPGAAPGDCWRIDFFLTGTAAGTPTVNVELFAVGATQPFKTVPASRVSGQAATLPAAEWFADATIDSTWASGRITAKVKVTGDTGYAGSHDFFVNALDATVRATPKANSRPYRPGEAVPLEGTVYKVNDVAGATQRDPAPATLKLRVTDADGNQLWQSGVLTASPEGAIPAVSIPAAATAGMTSTAERQFKIGLSVDLIDASYNDPLTGPWTMNRSTAGAVVLVGAPSTLLVDNSFVSALGWVKPGENYPFRVFVRNYTGQARSGVRVTIPVPDGTTFTQVLPLSGSGTATIGSGGGITWTVGTLGAAGAEGAPRVATLVVNARADTLSQDPEIVWKDLSTHARLTWTGGPTGGLTDESHGPKVIPPAGNFETARYGDKPFPMVPVDYQDRHHDPGHTGELLSEVVNSSEYEGSTFQLYQEMSYGQLFPFGFVPSAGIASAGFDYEPGFDFSEREPTKPACRGTTFGDLPDDVEPTVYGSPAYPERIRDGWYQLPGDTEYYGGDHPAFTLGLVGERDAACGKRAKAVYDAAQIADPEIDYNQFDSDKDGVVDFFMLVFVGLGGNGPSQLQATPPYDNIWPHSASLEFFYEDEATGLAGYISDDQLTDLTGDKQCWTDTEYLSYADCTSATNSRPVYVRVGPYNVNPESAIDFASVISHEYGHYLGLPDFYNTNYEVYNDWNLMATDYSQHMTIFGKQEMGWVVPEFLQPGDTRAVTNWNEIKKDTGQIRWQRPDGTFYTLSAANGDQNIHNGQAYALKLPARLVIDAEKIKDQASAPFVWWSGRGNDFGCPPTKGHNLDIHLPDVETVADGTPITLTFRSSWDIEWDWDYGFTMVSTDGANYTALPSRKGYTTTASTTNPNDISCADQYEHGLTGQSGAYADPVTAPAVVAAARAPNSPSAYSNGSPFLTDEYDLSAYAGEEGGVTLRFSYFTDPAFDRPGWFIDNVKVTAGDRVLYESNFDQDAPDPRIFPGGCSDEGEQVANKCTVGWTRISAESGAPSDHAYYLELRDRSGFDNNGRGQADRGSIAWRPGALIEYTDESRGYGNNGSGQPPNQHYLDSHPTPGQDCAAATTCRDAAFTAAAGDRHFDDDPDSNNDNQPDDWVDNFTDASSPDNRWHFAYDCLTLDVNSMSGEGTFEDTLPSDLTANATIAAGTGCARFSYTGSYPNSPPHAVASARPNPARVGDTITFDGSGSADDRQAPENLTYRWDFTGDGRFDATGQVVRHAYDRVGQYNTVLRVTDRNGASDTTTLQVVVTGSTAPDLVVSRIEFRNVRDADGRKRVRVLATITNAGNRRAGPSATRIMHSTQFIGLKETPALDPGASVVIKGTWNACTLVNRHNVDVWADWRREIGESNESNNYRTKGANLANCWVTS